MAQTLENLKAAFEFIRRMADWDAQLQYDLARIGEDQEWGIIDLFRSLQITTREYYTSKIRTSALNTDNSGFTIIPSPTKEVHVDYIITGWSITIEWASEPFTQYYQRFTNTLWAGIDSTNYDALGDRFTTNECFKTVSPTKWFTLITVRFPEKIRLPFNYEIQYSYGNYSGVNIDASKLTCYLHYMKALDKR